MTLTFWRDNIDRLLEFQAKDVLQGKGSISNKQMEAKVKLIYEDFNKRRKSLEAAQADKDDFDELNGYIENLKK